MFFKLFKFSSNYSNFMQFLFKFASHYANFMQIVFKFYSIYFNLILLQYNDRWLDVNGSKQKTANPSCARVLYQLKMARRAGTIKDTSSNTEIWFTDSDWMVSTDITFGPVRTLFTSLKNEIEQKLLQHPIVFNDSVFSIRTASKKQWSLKFRRIHCCSCTCITCPYPECNAMQACLDCEQCTSFTGS